MLKRLIKMENTLINKEFIQVALEELTTSKNRYANLIPVARHQFELETYRKRKQALESIIFYLDNLDIIEQSKLEIEESTGVDGFFKRLFLEVKQYG